MPLSEEALAAHSFEYSAGSIDETLVKFIQSFYSYADDRDTADGWATSFTETGVMKKAALTVSGRQDLGKLMQDSWKGLKSRQHVVYKVFPFNPGKPTEVMLYGLSKYVYEDETTGEMSWSARLCFERPDDDTVLLSFYNIFPSSPPKSA